VSVVEVTTWLLEMRDRALLRPARPPDTPFPIERAAVVQPELNRFLYTAVGGDWYWTGRLPWTYERWRNWLDRPEVETWIARRGANPAGYFELEQQDRGDVELAYFGLMPQFIGHGLGGHLLTAAISRAWDLPGTRRVWVHTCSLDHPAALANYQARGLEIFEVETEIAEVADAPPGPWRGANRSQPE
jgi:GNAT superfamily N-acetyltransferase